MMTRMVPQLRRSPSRLRRAPCRFRHQDLGPLQFNQAVPPGPTFTETYALVDAAGEQAIDAGDDVGPQLDQNGRLRPVGLPSDIGSTQDE
jgi:hypothetical protein